MNNFGKTAPSALLALAMCGVAGTAMAQEGSEDVIVVRGALVPDEKQNTSEISSLVDAEDFQRQGDSDIASALKRVTGLSIVDGKFPVARGLNERYSQTTLNGVPLPSPEPLRRAAPLDLIPTKILSGSMAQKTFSPQYSGEFGGAAIDLETVRVPEESYLQLEAGFSVDTESTMRSGYFYEGSDTDFLGFDDGLRDLPSVADEYVRNPGSVDQAALDTAFDQNDTLLITGDEVPANGKLSATAGYVFADTADYRVGTTFSIGYNNEWDVRDGYQDRRDTVTRVSTEDFEETRQSIEFNAFNTTGVEFGNGDHEIALTTYILRSSLKRARIADFQDTDVREDVLFRREATSWVEREVWQTQLNGSHLFPNLSDLEMDWRVAYGEASREAPYDRQTVRTRESDGRYAYFEGENFNTLEFSTLEDENLYGGIDFTVPFDLGQFPVEFAFGGAYTDNSRDNLRRDFDFEDLGSASGVPDELEYSRIDLIYSEPVLASDIINLDPVAGALFPDASTASLEVAAAYAMAEIEFNEYLRASVGARFEDSTEESSVFLTSAPEDEQNYSLEDDFLLPAVTVTWNPFGNLQVRGAYSETITRPQFRELAFTDFLDPNLDITLSGNPFLVNTEIENYDIRAEWYFARGEFLTIGAFYKDIQNPIEQYFTGREGGAVSYLNAPSAELFGAEFEFEKRFALDELLGGDNWYGKELVFVTNYTYSDSEVSADGTVTTAQLSQGQVTPRTRDASGAITDGRKLQGQSDHLFNVQLGYEDIDSGTKVTGLLNYASERVVLAEAVDGSSPAVLEQPPVTLDLVISQDIELGGAEYGLGIKVQNILGSGYDAYRELDTIGERPFLEYDRGTEFSISLSREF